MRRFILLFVLVVGSLGAKPASAGTITAQAGVRERTGMLIARWASVARGTAPGVDGFRVVREYPEVREVVLRVPAGMSEVEAERRLEETGLFEYVHPNWRVFPIAETNDPRLREQWHLYKTSAIGAWDVSAGDPSVVVAVTDSGVDLSHPDLQGQLVPGYNAVDGRTQAEGGLVSDVMNQGHGTRIAGLIAARADNGIGVAGIAHRCRVMPVRVTNAANGSALLDQVLSGIRWAADNGARVVSTSYTGVENAAAGTTGTYCADRQVVSVWGAGNQGLRLDGFDWPDVVVVGATDQNDVRATFSNWGKAVDLMAPGVGLLSTARGGGYVVSSGTSYAAPLVAGAIAVASHHRPLEFRRSVMRALQASADLGVDGDRRSLTYLPGNDRDTGWGRLNLDRMLVRTEPKYTLRILNPLPGYTHAYAKSINDSGEIVGYCDMPRKVGVVWRPPLYLPEPMPNVAPDARHIAWDINRRGQISLTSIDSANMGSWRVEPNGSFVTLPSSNALVKSAGINDHGWIAVLDSLGRSMVWDGNTAWFLDNPWGGQRREAYDINNAFIAVGHGQLSNSTSFRSVAWDVSVAGSSISAGWGSALGTDYIWRISDSGLMVGDTTTGGGRIAGVLHAWSFGGGQEHHGLWPNNYVFEPTRADELFDVNDSMLAVGHGSERALVYQFPFGGDASFWLADRLIEPLPSTVNYLWMGQGIAGDGRIAGDLMLKNGQARAFLATPVDVFEGAADLGQLGSNPIYLGTLPTTLMVEFRRPDGTSYPFGAVPALYDARTGSVRLNMPDGITGDFRVRMKPNRYLGRVYPPAGSPALPRETRSIPMQSFLTGDIDDDNAVTVFDYDLLSAAFDSYAGGPGWDERADLDGDLAITVFDYDLLSVNFDRIGDD